MYNIINQSQLVIKYLSGKIAYIYISSPYTTSHYVLEVIMILDQSV